MITLPASYMLKKPEALSQAVMPFTGSRRREPALDVNGDGKVNNKDLTRLQRYVKGADVELH